MIEVALGHANKPKPKQCLSPLLFWHRGKQKDNEAKTIEVSCFDIPNFQKLTNNDRDMAVLERIDMSSEMNSHNDFKLCFENQLRNSLQAMIRKFPKKFDEFVSLQSDVILSSLYDYAVQDIRSAYEVKIIQTFLN